MGVHQLMLRFSKYYHVVYVDQPVGWRDALRPREAPALGEKERARWPGFQVYQPEAWLPKLYRPRWLADLTFRARLWRARRRLERLGCRRIVLYVFHPRYGAALDLLPHDVSCYHLEDDYSYSTTEVPTSAYEAELIARVDQVFVHSPALFEKKCGANPHSMLVPNGVDYEAYSTEVPEPEDLSAVPHPRIGYTGWIKKQLDLELVRALAERRPDWSFVFVGAVLEHPEIYPLLDALRRRPNVHFLGAKPTEELATYPQHFDVCIMPYAVNDYTRYIYPLKLHEYLASGRPVVGAPIHALEELRGTIGLARTPEEWDEAVARALAEADDPVAREARRAGAREHDWETRTAQMAGAIADRLEERASPPPAPDTEEGAPTATRRHH